jgi:carbon starvation protein CstA
MSLFFISAALLIAGYFTYGVFVDRLFKPDANRTTPAYAHTDGVDFVPMKVRQKGSGFRF